MRVTTFLRSAALTAVLSFGSMVPLAAQQQQQQPAETTEPAKTSAVPSALAHTRDVGPVLRQAPRRMAAGYEPAAAFRRDSQVTITATTLGLVLLVILLVVLL